MTVSLIGKVTGTFVEGSVNMEIGGHTEIIQTYALIRWERK